MTTHKIIQSPDPALLEVAAAFHGDYADIPDVINAMKEALRSEGGIGLAAPQIGIPQQIIIVCAEADPAGLVQAFINPVIEFRLGKQRVIEGCLSVPGEHGEVERDFKVRVRAMSVNGHSFSYTASGYEAACIQHECDHLIGVLFPTRASRMLDSIKEEAISA